MWFKLGTILVVPWNQFLRDIERREGSLYTSPEISLPEYYQNQPTFKPTNSVIFLTHSRNKRKPTEYKVTKVLEFIRQVNNKYYKSEGYTAPCA